MGRFDAGVAATRRAVGLDPLSRLTHSMLGSALYYARRNDLALAAYAEVISLDPNFKQSYGFRGLGLFGLGDLEHARTTCEVTLDYWFGEQCLAVVYDKLGRHADAEVVLSKMKATEGDSAAYQYATIYAQWGDRAKAHDWFEVAWRLHAGGFDTFKTDPLMDLLRQEPRVQAIMNELKFPD